MGRRYEPADDNGYDDYAHYQPARAKKPSEPGVPRYEIARPTLSRRQDLLKGKFIYIYKNGKPDEKRVRVTFSRKMFVKMESLCDEIQRITKTNVMYLFRWPTGEQVYDTMEIAQDEENTYICSATKNLDKKKAYGGICYGGGSGESSAFLEKYSRNSHDSRRSEKPSPTLRSQASNGALRSDQIPLNVISNTNRNSRQSILFNPNGTEPFETILKNIQGMVEMEYPPCKALFSVVKPYKKVESISTLKRVIQQYGDTFWACGREGDPMEKLQGTPDESPTRNGQRRNGHRQQQQRDDRMRESNGHAQARQTNRYGQYEEDDEEMEDYQPDQHRDVSPQRNVNKRINKQPDNRQSQNRQSRRYEEQEVDERRDDRRGKGDRDRDDRRGSRDDRRASRDERNGHDEEDSSRKDKRRGKQRDESEERGYRKAQRRGSSPSPRRNGDGNEDDDDHIDEEYDDRVKYDPDDHPSEQEMEKRVEKMERADSDLDAKIHY